MPMSPIKRPSLGQIAHLGDFYDAGTDTFSSLSLLKGPPPPNTVRRTDNPKTEVDVIKEDTYEEKFRRIGVDAELGASILSGLMAVGGIGNFLVETRSSDRTRQISCLYKITTVHEMLMMGAFINPEFKGMLDIDALRACPGTHIVSEIEWGASSAVTARYDVEDASSGNEVQAKLEVGLEELNKIVGVGVKARGGVQAGRGKKSERTTFSIKVYGDFITDREMPTDFDSARDYIKSMHSSVSTYNDGKGKPLAYTLLPINILAMMFYDLEIKFQVALNRLSHEVLEQFVQLFDEWTRVRQTLTDHLADVKRYEFCLPAGHRREASENLRQAKIREARLKESYGKTLADVRRGLSDPTCLLALLADSRSGDSSPENLTAIVRRHQGRMKFAAVIQSKGAHFVGHDMRAVLDNLLIATSDRSDTYILYFNEAVQCQTERWNDSRKLLMELLNSKEETDRVIVCDCDLGGFRIDTSYLEHYRGGKLISKDMVAARRLLEGYCLIRYSPGALDSAEYFPPNLERNTVQEINVLILGETGVGKSTWINAFVNYLTYDTLEQAMGAETPEYVVPYSFSYQLMDEDGNFHQYDIEVGESAEERSGAKGESATQRTVVYKIQLGDETVLRLIDTPGIGDTRGISQDALNKEDILATLQNIDKLHGILILLRPANARLGVMFRFCITELMTHLHRDAINNICFGFTNTRGSNYSPGDTYNPLQKLLSEYKGATISLNHHNTYCFDSESFRFLAALSETKRQLPGLRDFKRSWDRSVRESKRLLEHWATLPGHRVKSTLSLNKARDILLAIEEPLKKLKEATEKTIIENKENAEALRQCDAEIESVRSRLHIKTVTVNIKALAKPRMVCSEGDCRKTVRANDGETYFVYEKPCHDNCHMLPGSARFGDPFLLACRVFDHGRRRTCKQCNHHWKSHLHIDSEYRTQRDSRVDPDVLRLMHEAVSAKQLQAYALRVLTQFIEKCEREQRLLAEASTEFARYLGSNSIVPYNHERIPYIEAQLKAACYTVGEDRVGSADATPELSRNNSLSSLRGERQIYMDEEEAIRRRVSKNVDSQGAAVPTDDMIEKLLQQLFDMEEWGPKLKRIALRVEAKKLYTERAFQRHADLFGHSRSNTQPFPSTVCSGEDCAVCFQAAARGASWVDTKSRTNSRTNSCTPVSGASLLTLLESENESSP
ncbi:Stonustoxin subunit alpha [Echria macrotheca]|uniref:Stonustoxin subunit alpha n=1 Tax=Echria macrotheca TaxID=438768 RepID=A0AAJ0B7A3_9PEZI|nr:Stonustoxin subunit alpha [Echria macrotheca]